MNIACFMLYRAKKGLYLYTPKLATGQSSFNNHNYIEMTNNTQRPSDTISWLGFSFSLFALLLLCLTIFAVTCTNGLQGTSAFMLAFLFGTPIGIGGLVLSIIGLVKAGNNGGKKWIGSCGLIFTGLSILCIFIPIFVATAQKSHDIKIDLTENIAPDSQQENEVVLAVDGYQLKCYDNRNHIDNTPYETRIEYSLQVEKEIDVWFKMHNIENNDYIILKASQDTDYSQVADLIEALNKLGMTNFQLTSALQNH